MRAPVWGWAAVAPKSLPSLELMVDDIGASPDALAVHLGVSERTVRGWLGKGVAPRAAQLALFYETRWGRSFVSVDADNRASLAGHLLSLERRRVAELQGALDAAVRVGEFGSANLPSTLARSESVSLEEPFRFRRGRQAEPLAERDGGTVQVPESRSRRMR